MSGGHDETKRSGGLRIKERYADRSVSWVALVERSSRDEREMKRMEW